jgi:hypothetical protein
MVDWDPNDYRIFVGDLGNEVNDDILYKAFSHYGSIKKAKMVKNKITGKNKGASRGPTSARRRVVLLFCEYLHLPGHLPRVPLSTMPLTVS